MSEFGVDLVLILALLRGFLFIMIHVFFGWVVEFIYHRERCGRWKLSGFPRTLFIPFYGVASMILIFAEKAVSALTRICRGLRIISNFDGFFIIFAACFLFSLALFALTRYLAYFVTDAAFGFRTRDRGNMNEEPGGRVTRFTRLSYWGALGAAYIIFLLPPIINTIKAVEKRPVFIALLFSAFSLGVSLILEINLTVKEAYFFQSRVKRLESVGLAILAGYQDELSGLDDKRGVYHSKIRFSRLEWQRAVLISNVRRRFAPPADRGAFSADINQANQSLRDSLRTLKDDMMSEAGERDLIYERFYDEYRRAIRKSMVALADAGDFDNFIDFIRVFPYMSSDKSHDLTGKKVRSRWENNDESDRIDQSARIEVIRCLWSELRSIAESGLSTDPPRELSIVEEVSE